MSQNMDSSEAFKTAFAQTQRAAELASKMAESQHLKRRQTAELVRLLNEAACAARSLDNYRKHNPLPDYIENE